MWLHEDKTQQKSSRTQPLEGVRGILPQEYLQISNLLRSYKILILYELIRSIRHRGGASMGGAMGAVSLLNTVLVYRQYLPAAHKNLLQLTSCAAQGAVPLEQQSSSPKSSLVSHDLSGPGPQVHALLYCTGTVQYSLFTSVQMELCCVDKQPLQSSWLSSRSPPDQHQTFTL